MSTSAGITTDAPVGRVLTILSDIDTVRKHTYDNERGNCGSVMEGGAAAPLAGAPLRCPKNSKYSTMKSRLVSPFMSQRIKVHSVFLFDVLSSLLNFRVTMFEPDSDEVVAESNGH